MSGSCQAAELNSDHSDVDPSLGTGLSSFVIANQPSVTHQPSKGALHDPATRQYLEALGSVAAFDNLDGQIRAKAFDPLGEGLAGVATIHPQNAQPGEPTQNSAQEQLCPVAFGGVGGSDRHAEHQSQGIDQQMPLPALDLLAGVIADRAAMTIGLHTLTVQDRGRWPTALRVGFPHENAQSIVKGRALMIGDPLPEHMINRFPLGKIGGKIAPRATALNQIEDGINDPPPISGWPSAFGRFGKHRFEVSPLGISQIRVVLGDFHRLTGAAANEGRSYAQQNQALYPSSWLL